MTDLEIEGYIVEMERQLAKAVDGLKRIAEFLELLKAGHA